MRIAEGKISDSDELIGLLFEIVNSEKEDPAPNYTLRYKYLEKINSKKELESIFPMEELHHELVNNSALRTDAINLRSEEERRSIERYIGYAVLGLILTALGLILTTIIIGV
ncbi:TPA: hypothetical protein ACVU5P_004180 [Vibrio parahaemolyticus]